MKDVRKISLLYVVNACLPNGRAHGIQIINTCQALSQAGADLTLVTPSFFGIKGSIFSHYGIDQKFKHKKLFSFDIPGFSQRFRLRSAFFFVFVNIYVLFALCKCILRGERLVVYARGEVVFSLFPFSYLIPVFFETHQIRNYEKAYRQILKRVVGIVVITNRLRRKFVEEYNIKALKILVARDSVDLDKFKNIPKNSSLYQKVGVPEGKKVILYTGSLGSEKGVYTLAEAAGHLPEDCHIVFLGGLEAQVTLFRKKYNHLLNVTIAGQVSHTLIPEYMSSADVVILPDLSTDTYANLYTSPMKLFEYMASGVPIVASDVPSLREVLDSDSAVFFDSGDPKSLATAIKEVLSNPTESEKFGLCAQNVVSEFTWLKRGERIYAHVKNIMQ